MAQQNSTYYSILKGNSQPRTQSIGYSTDLPAKEIPRASEMARKISNDSAYYSAVSEVSEEPYYSKQSRATMSFGAESPIYYENDHMSAQQYLQPSYLKPSTILERSNSEWSHSSHATPSSLRWSPDAIPLHLYKFVIPKGKDPFFQLRDSSWASSNTPDKVFLDSPR
jgi:hypothetical protein